jgi:hypothetical protein
VIFQEKRLKILKCCTFLWVQRWHNCSPAASFTNCVMTKYLLKVHLQTILTTPTNSKTPNFELWHSCRKWAICYGSKLRTHWNIVYSSSKIPYEEWYLGLSWQWKWRSSSLWLSHRIVRCKFMPPNIQEDALSTTA